MQRTFFDWFALTWSTWFPVPFQAPPVRRRFAGWSTWYSTCRDAKSGFFEDMASFSLKEDPPEIYTNILHTTHSVQTLQKAWNWWKLHSNCDAQAISPGAHTTTHDLRASDSNPLAHSDFTKSSSWIAGIATSFYESWKPLFTKHVIVFIEVLGRDWKSLVFGA